MREIVQIRSLQECRELLQAHGDSPSSANCRFDCSQCIVAEYLPVLSNNSLMNMLPKAESKPLTQLTATQSIVYEHGVGVRVRDTDALLPYTGQCGEVHKMEPYEVTLVRLISYY